MKRLALLLIGAFLLGGCLAPEYIRTPGEIPGDYRFQAPNGQPRPELATLADLAWWEIFDDPALQNLIGIALALSLIHISEPTRPFTLSRMPSSA